MGLFYNKRRTVGFLQFAFSDGWLGLIFGVEADEYVAFAEALGLRLEL